MALFTDQTGKTIFLQGIPQHIASLVPSQTELLYHLGLDQSVAGITRFCVHPDHWFRSKKRVGGTKSLHLEMIKRLQPDLVLANREENMKEQVEALGDLFPVWTSDVGNLQQALDMINAFGNLTGTAARAGTLADTIAERFSRLPPAAVPLRAAYLIWQDPYMTVGGDTFIHHMMELAGFENIFKDLKRYPAISLEMIRELDCRLLLLASEPFPFSQKHIPTIQQQLPDVRILLADGQMFSWYGSRLLLAPGYFSQLRLKTGQA